MESPPAAATTRTLPRRLFWTAVLVLVALGGAGLATAADRPATGALRPELSARADRHAEGWLQGLIAQLHAVDGGMRQLAGHAREVLGSIQRLEPDALGTLLDDGDTVATDVDAMVVLLAQMRAGPPPGLDPTRLSPANRQILAGVDEVLTATATSGAAWRELSRMARVVSETGGATIAEAVLSLERARGVVARVVGSLP